MPRRFRWRRTARRRSFNSDSTTSSIASRARTETRGCWERLRGRFGVIVVAIAFLLKLYLVGPVGRIELVRCKVRPIRSPERRRAAAHPSHRGRRADKKLLGLVLND